MLSKEICNQIALKRFSLISPVLNGQVNNQLRYFEEVCAKAIDMPHYGLKNYSPKTLCTWYHLYLRGGLEALKPGGRSDKGKSRKIDPAVGDHIILKVKQYPRITKRMLYEELIKENIIVPKDVSLATFYRYLAIHPDLLNEQDQEASSDELRRFSHKYINELWQADVMYGPYLTVGRKKKQTYLLAYIDDASRLITHASFHFEQNFESLRSTLKNALLSRGVPKLLYTDNGTIYRCSQLSMICASVGFSLLHAKPYTPTSKGKIERFFQTVRMRFLSCLDLAQIKDLDDLNNRFSKWLLEDYQCREHSALGMCPLDFFMKQVDHIHLISDPDLLNEHFLLRVNRKVHHDATIKLKTLLYETNPAFSNKKVEIRYDPNWLLDATKPIFIFEDNKKIGEARQVNMYENAYVKRKNHTSKPLSTKDSSEENTHFVTSDNKAKNSLIPSNQTVSFRDVMNENMDKEEVV